MSCNLEMCNVYLLSDFIIACRHCVLLNFVVTHSPLHLF